MKTLISALFFMGFVVYLSAQDCSQSFYALKQGVHIQYTFYSDKGEAKTITDQTIQSVSTTSTGGIEATISQNMSNTKGKTYLTNSVSKVVCEGGAIKMNISDMSIGESLSKFKDMDITVSGDGVQIPSTMEVGQTLPDGLTEIKVGMKGMNLMSMNFKISNRKVEGKESKTTAAGTYDCYKISYDMDVKAMGKRNFHVVQWLAKGVGMVRSENYKDNKLDNYMELTKLDK